MVDQVRAGDLVEVVDNTTLYELVDKRYNAPGANDEVIPPLTATVEKLLNYTYTLKGGDKRYAYRVATQGGYQYVYYDAIYKERDIGGGTVSEIHDYKKYMAVVNVADMTRRQLQITIVASRPRDIRKDNLDQVIRLVRAAMKKTVTPIAIHSVAIGEQGAAEQPQDGMQRTIIVTYTIPIHPRGNDKVLPNPGALSSDRITFIQKKALEPKLSAIGIRITEATVLDGPGPASERVDRIIVSVASLQPYSPNAFKRMQEKMAEYQSRREIVQEANEGVNLRPRATFVDLSSDS